MKNQQSLIELVARLVVGQMEATLMDAAPMAPTPILSMGLAVGVIAEAGKGVGQPLHMQRRGFLMGLQPQLGPGGLQLMSIGYRVLNTAEDMLTDCAR